MNVSPGTAAAGADRRLWAELLRRVRRDQELRRRWAAVPGIDPDRSLLAELAAVDAANSAWLAEVVARGGWPGWAMVGEDGAMAAWMLAQHADAFPDRQQQFLVALAEAAGRGDASAAQLAYLEDRVRANAGRPQRYGTQSTGTDAGAGSPLPIEDPGGLAARTFQAVLFDLDGTLIDSTPSVDRSWARWAALRGLDRASFHLAHGVPARQILAAFLPAEQVEAAFTELEAMEVADADGILVLPGALEALPALPAGWSAIVTSCTHPLAVARIACTGLPAPTVVVTAGDVSAGKPDPAPYLLAASRLGVHPAHCLVVEDAPAGLAAGRAAGCATLAVATTHPADQLRADAVVGSLADVTFAAAPEGVRVQVHQAVGGPR